MAFLVTGGTGTTGSQLIEHLIPAQSEIRVLTRSPETASLPGIVNPVKGDLADVASVAQALRGVRTLFLLVPNVADEFTQTMNALNLARDADVRGIVYLSVYRCDEYLDVPHVTCKQAIERMIAATDLPATVLRAAYFMQNDWRQEQSLLESGSYSAPIGHKGVPMVDTRDIAQIAANELLRRHGADTPLPPVTLNLVGPENLTGAMVAGIWSEVLGKTIRYGDDELTAFEQHLRDHMPAWFAYDLRLMFRHYQTHGTPASQADIDRMAALLGRPPRSYRDFALEASRAWAAAHHSIL